MKTCEVVGERLRQVLNAESPSNRKDTRLSIGALHPRGQQGDCRARRIAFTLPCRACHRAIRGQMLFDCFVGGAKLVPPSSTCTSQKAQIAICVAPSHTNQGVATRDSSTAVFLSSVRSVMNETPLPRAPWSSYPIDPNLNPT